ncbi:hypothetical protein BDA99DRAFT_566556 [Phascolomyces articulosus]|uniref:Uncharacterized protein n=1 Tax=Phascolomyces articulosus TaxID=60185 RepID=A0AAD5JZ13_9FUNG|nr:hypothetical protein BDA99DRAFT_566556 [Phascolomyces articulosus]
MDQKHVENGLDWNKIQAYLRLTDEKLTNTEKDTAVLNSLKDIYMGPTHITCESTMSPKSDAYLFSIVAKHTVIGQGYPLVFMITDKEDSEALQM